MGIEHCHCTFDPLRQECGHRPNDWRNLDLDQKDDAGPPPSTRHFLNVNQHASMDRLPCCIFICISQGIHGREREHRQTLQSRVFLLVEDRQDVLEFHFHNIKFSCFYVQFMLCTFSFDYMFVMLKIV